MATTSVETNLPLNPERKLIAPLWHTIVFVLFILGYAYYGRTTVPRIEGMHLQSKVWLYLFMILLELLLVSYVWFLGGSDRHARRITTFDGQKSADRQSRIHVSARQPPGNNRVGYFVGDRGLLRGICFSRLSAEAIPCNLWF